MTPDSRRRAPTTAPEIGAEPGIVDPTAAGVETEPKGRRNRYVPLSDPAVAALARLAARVEFTGDDDYVVCNRWGRRLDPSALRCRYHLACTVAGLRRVKLHRLRHAAGSILARSPGHVS